MLKARKSPVYRKCACFGYAKRTFVEMSEHSDIRSPDMFLKVQNIVAFFGTLHPQYDNSVYSDHQTHIYYPLLKLSLTNYLHSEICLRFSIYL